MKLALRTSFAGAHIGVEQGAGLAYGTVHGLRHQAGQGSGMVSGGDWVSGHGLGLSEPGVQHDGTLWLATGGGGAPDFVIGKPGDLGPYMPTQKRYFVWDGATRDERIQRAREAWRDADAAVGHSAQECLRRAAIFEANPKAYFTDNGFDGNTFEGYLGLSHWGRITRLVKWGECGWELTEAGHGRASELGFRIDDQPRARARYFSGVGQTTQGGIGQDPGVEGRKEITSILPPVWDDVQEVLLAMRFFTEEQIAMLWPSLSLWDVRGALRGWEDERMIRPFGGEFGVPGVIPNSTHKVPSFRVTRAAAELAFDSGILGPGEVDSRLVIKRGQEEHDLVVGDGIMMVALKETMRGHRLSEVLPENCLIQRKWLQDAAYLRTAGKSVRRFAGKQWVGATDELKRLERLDPGLVQMFVSEPRLDAPYPDFRISTMRPQRSVFGFQSWERSWIDVEVVGQGGDYRSSAKMKGASRASQRLLIPGWSGHGVAYV